MIRKKSLIILSVLVIAACDVFTTVSGKITDESGSPIAGATIILEPSNTPSVRSDENGVFSITDAHWGKPKFTIVVYKDGFYSSSVELPASDGGMFERNIVLKSDEMKVPQGDFDIYQ